MAPLVHKFIMPVSLRWYGHTGKGFMMLEDLLWYGHTGTSVYHASELTAVWPHW